MSYTFEEDFTHPFPGNLIGQKAPDFTTQAIMPDNTIDEKFTFSDYLKDSYGWIFFYPLDFTFVCPSEILAHNNRLKEFEERHTKIISVSVDSQYTHLAWKNTPVEKGGLGQIQFPMVADLTKEIAESYGVLIPDQGVALRGSFLIDKQGIVRHQVINDLPLGRNVDEALRMIDALLFHEEHGEVCPAGWQKGKKGMNANPEGVAKYLAEESDKL